MNRVVALIFGLAGLWFLFFLASPRSLGEAVVKFVFAAILLLFAYRRFRASSKKTAEYVKQEDGAWLELKVKPAAAPVLWFPSVLSLVLGGSVVGSGQAYLWVLGLLVASLTALVLLKDHRGGNATSPHHFRVSPDGIETQGTFLRKDDIHHLRIRNKFAGSVEITYDVNQGVPIGTTMGLAGRRALAEVAYRVEVEAGGKAYVLAAGLDEVTARGITAEVAKALKLGASPT
jgi:hypothetical protein